VRRRHQHVQRRRDVLQSDQLRNASHRDYERRQLLGTITVTKSGRNVKRPSDTLTMYLKHYVIGCGDLDVTLIDIACFMCMQYFVGFY